MDFVDAGCFCHSVRIFLGIAGQHRGDNVFGTDCGDCVCRFRLDRIRNDEMTDECAVQRSKNFCTVVKGCCVHRYMELIHQLPVSAEHLALGQGGTDPVAGDFFHLGRCVQGNLFVSCRRQNALGNRMCGILFTGCTESQQSVGIRSVCGNGFLQLEISLGDRSGLIHDNGADIFHSFQGNSAFEENAPFASGADSGEERQRHTQYQGAWAADDQEGDRGVDPVIPVAGHQ